MNIWQFDIVEIFITYQQFKLILTYILKQILEKLFKVEKIKYIRVLYTNTERRASNVKRLKKNKLNSQIRKIIAPLLRSDRKRKKKIKKEGKMN